MKSGLLSGILWGLDTVIIGFALSSSHFAHLENSLFLAPIISTFLHDSMSSLWMFLYMGIKKEYAHVVKALKTRSGKFIILGALAGGPLGMTGYLIAIQNIGAAHTAIISSLYPAVGAFLSFIFLKERLKPYQIVSLCLAITGIILLSYSPDTMQNTQWGLGIIGSIMCVFGWSGEAVICAYGMKDPNISNEHALHIRQTTSAVFYGLVLIPVFKAFQPTLDILQTWNIAIIAGAALAGTTSYILYYFAINKIGPGKAMSLNVTYVVWTVVFGVILMGESISLYTTLLGIAVVLCSLVTAADIPQLLTWKKNRTHS